MAQSWFKRHFGWIARDFRAMVQELKEPETWIVLGIMFFFGLIVYFGFHLVKKTDSLLNYIYHTASLCKELTNGAIIFLFSGTFFFFLCAILTFGELTQHFNFKKHNAHVQSRRAALLALFWGLGAIVIVTAVILFLDRQCL